MWMLIQEENNSKRNGGYSKSNGGFDIEFPLLSAAIARPALVPSC
jgi:hypothetical protein